MCENCGPGNGSKLPYRPKESTPILSHFPFETEAQLQKPKRAPPGPIKTWQRWFLIDGTCASSAGLIRLCPSLTVVYVFKIVTAQSELGHFSHPHQPQRASIQIRCHTPSLAFSHSSFLPNIIICTSHSLGVHSTVPFTLPHNQSQSP